MNSDQNELLSRAQKLESILRDTLRCNYGDFGIKANNNLLSKDWKTPISFVLGYKFANSDNSDIHSKISYFMGNLLTGENIRDFYDNYQKYGYNSQSEALTGIDDIIKEIDNILKSE